MGETSIPREFLLHNNFLNDIPLRVRRGLTITEIQFTCLDAVDQFIAIGTNIGIVYWCNRKTNKVERLRPEKYSGPVTCVKTVSSVDYMVAFGNNKGDVSIFVIPKEKPKFMPLDQSQFVKNSVERFTASGIHTSSITAVEWSLNGQKLFTGDEKGIVGLTQMDFHLNIIKSMEILNEKFPIVQLCYSQPHLLLIASENRCIIYNEIADDKICQVGQKERINLCKLGAIIGSHSSIQGPAIFSARLKQRIWLADVNGQVCKTFLLKDALAQNFPAIELYSGEVESRTLENHNEKMFPKSSLNTSSRNALSDIEFSFLKIYLGKFLLVYDRKNLLLLNSETTSIVGGLQVMRIISVATHKDEIFVLEGYRRIKRLALSEDPYSRSVIHQIKNSSDSTVGGILREVVNKIKEEASQSVKPILKNLKKMEDNILESDILPADEALNLDPIYNEANISVLNVDAEDKVSKVFSERKLNSSNSNDKIAESSSIASCSSVLSFDEVNPEKIEKRDQSSALHIPFEEIPRDIAPDMRTPESIMRDVIDKEKKLAHLLNLNFSSHYETTQLSPEVNSLSSPNKDDRQVLSPHSPLETFNLQTKHLCEMNVTSPCDENPNIEKNPNDEKEKNAENLFERDALCSDDGTVVQNCCEGCWKQLNLPFSPKWICVTNVKIYAGESKLAVYVCNTKIGKFLWTKQKYRALKVAVSLNGDICWKLDPNIAYAYVHNSNKWEVTAREVKCIAVNDVSAWYIRKGQIYVQLNLTREKSFSDNPINIECPNGVSNLCIFSNAIWILTDNGQIFSRNGITNNNPVGSSWKKISTPENVVVINIVLACRNSGWIIDKHNNIFFTDNYDDEKVDWWQVIVGRHVYGNDSSLSDQLSKFVNWSKESSSSTLIGSNEISLWVTNAGECSVYVNKTALLGHRWLPVKEGTYVKNKWKFICASGLWEETNVLWCVNSNNDIFLSKKSTGTFRPIEAPTTKEIVCISAERNTFWVLTEDGKVFIRIGISDSNPFGCIWEEVDISQDSCRALVFKQLACSADIIWGIDSKDEIYTGLGEPSIIANNANCVEWKRVEDFTPHGTKLIDIVIGHNKCMVWAIDVKYNVYVRQAIFDDFPLGTEWVIVPGIKAINLTISSSTVWALTADGNIYRRYGVSPINFIGDYWLQVPGLLSQISVSPSDDLWGVSKINGRLQKYEKHILGINENFIEKRRFSESIEEDWEIIS